MEVRTRRKWWLDPSPYLCYLRRRSLRCNAKTFLTIPRRCSMPMLVHKRTICIKRSFNATQMSTNEPFASNISVHPMQMCYAQPLYYFRAAQNKTLNISYLKLALSLSISSDSLTQTRTLADSIPLLLPATKPSPLNPSPSLGFSIVEPLDLSLGFNSLLTG